ncbi:hypothetical protein NBZ79_05195 [Sneathiella marina]|uniref:Sel1 repeat family protein n=1 Tax=Sneathiella marina TaxID=2950108 RepID=A0ABY4W5A3_9PROT|nr:hypothetical protein [Sneathiella marina]USG62375.1 hypothetical protein NBZ79_05195 [Sneathiella marina]
MYCKRLGVALAVFLMGTNLASADFQDGQKAFDQKDYSTATEQWRLAAHKGDERAQFSLGKLFEEGADGIEIDLVKSYAWFKISAAQDVNGAKDALSRLKKEMTPGQIEEANAQAVAALGVWYRKYFNQNEDDFQKMKADIAAQKQQKLAMEKEAAKERADNQADLIAQRNADAKVAQQLEEENRKAAILAARQQAEEAKIIAFQEQQRIEEQQRLVALRQQQDEQKKLNEARTRLDELKAKQQGIAPEKSSTVLRTVPVAETAVAAVAVSSVAASAPTSTSESTASVAGATAVASVPVAAAASAQSIAVATPVALPSSVTEKPGGTNVVLQDAETTSEKIKIEAQEPVTQETVALAKQPTNVPQELLDRPGLDEVALIEIFELAQSVPLETEAAQTEISESLVRIDALKWSLISGVKGDAAAPKMNKVLMSKMTPVQIAEANRLAGEWLAKRQSRL